MRKRNTSAFNAVPLDTVTIPQDRLNIDNKERSNPFPWNGQFSPQLIEELLRTFAPTSGFVLDPLLGSGTVLYEAGRLGHPAFGAEINPAALKMAQAYLFINSSLATRRKAFSAVEEALDKLLPSPFGLMSHAKPQCKGHELKLSIAQQATQLDGKAAKRLFETLVVLLNFSESELTNAKVQATWDKLRNRVEKLPFSSKPLRVANCDARNLPLENGTVDFVITSPPYINVFNYHQQYRRSVEAMGWNLLTVAQSEIGSNRKHRQNRFLTVIQYCIDMTDVLNELRRVCKADARVILVVGRESRVRKTNFFNGEIISDLACRCASLSLERRQERAFTNRFGERIYEDILHFVLKKEVRPVESPLLIAEEALSGAVKRAPEESLSDLKSALSAIGDVKPSRLYVETDSQAEQIA